MPLLPRSEYKVIYRGAITAANDPNHRIPPDMMKLIVNFSAHGRTFVSRNLKRKLLRENRKHIIYNNTNNTIRIFIEENSAFKMLGELKPHEIQHFDVKKTGFNVFICKKNDPTAFYQCNRLISAYGIQVINKDYCSLTIISRKLCHGVFPSLESLLYPAPRSA